MAYKTTTIETVINTIDKKEYILPDIQREFVWNPEQIEQLFDSLIKGYPIGSFLLWKIDAEVFNSFKFYEFLKTYHPWSSKHNAEYNDNNLVSEAVLDGQQRLTALYIGLRGSYSIRKKNFPEHKTNSYIEKFLYFNLFYKSDQQEENDDKYPSFKFLSEEDSLLQNTSLILWYKVSDILSCKVALYCNRLDNNYSIEQKDLIADNLNDFQQLIKSKEIINYYLEKTKDQDKILDIFLRANSGGTKLSYSDLLLSTATALWSKRNAREEIYSFVDDINKTSIKINADFIMKSCLVLSDLEIQFKKKNFTKENMSIIESQWEDIKKYIQLTVDLMNNVFGYTAEYIPADNALIIIAYYLKIQQYDDSFITHAKYQQERNTILQWVRQAFLKQVFSGASDTTLKKYRGILKNNSTNSFPLQQVEQEFQGTRQDISISEDTLYQLYENATFNNKKSLYTVMSIIFGIPLANIKIQIDHLYPKSSFTSAKIRDGIFGCTDETKLKKYCNHITNLQFLETSANKCKSAQEFHIWLEKQKKLIPDYTKNSIIPELNSYKSENFIQFCEKRSELLFEIFKTKIRLFNE